MSNHSYLRGIFMNNLKNILSLLLFFIFFSSYILKLVILYKKDKIKANVLGKGKKVKDIKHTELFVKITTFLWGLSWFALGFIEKDIINLVGSFTDNFIVHFIGILFSFIGVMVFIQAMVSMKTSWRVGIDKNTKTSLVTYGIYKYSRNPAFVGFDIMFVGLFLTYPNFLILVLLMLNVFAIHRLILQEEKHLQSMFNEEYISYCKKTPRYFFFL